MYVYLPLFDFTFPGNTQAFLSFFMGLASCDFATSDYVFNEVLFYSPQNALTLTAYNEKFNNLGFDSMSMVYNMGDLSLIQFFVLVLVGQLIYFKLLACCKESAKVKARKTSVKLMFNWPIRFFMEAYLEICFGSWMKFLRGDLTFKATFEQANTDSTQTAEEVTIYTKTDAMDSFLGWFWLVLSVLIPVILALVLTCC
jgi:hypothetical protein